MIHPVSGYCKPSDRLRISSATTANPLPASPALWYNRFMYDLQKRVMETLDDIDDFLKKVRKSAGRMDTEELDILRLRGKFLMKTAEDLKDEAASAGGVSAHGSDPAADSRDKDPERGASEVSGAVASQLMAVLHMEAEGLRRTLEALEGADAAGDAVRESEQSETMRRFREALWKESKIN